MGMAVDGAGCNSKYWLALSINDEALSPGCCSYKSKDYEILSCGDSISGAKMGNTSSQ